MPTNNILSDIFWEEPNVYKNEIKNSKSHLTVWYNVCFHYSYHKPYIIRISYIYSNTKWQEKRIIPSFI